MSYQDISQNGGASASSAGVVGNDSDKQTDRLLADKLFRIATCVSTFKHLINRLGTSKDNPQLREKIHKTEQDISKLVMETVTELKAAKEADHGTEVSYAQKIAYTKLAKDFDSLSKEFQNAQKRVLEHKSSFVSANGLNSNSSPGELNLTEWGSRNEEQKALLGGQRRQEVLALHSEVVHNESIIEEREEGIKEIQQQIGEVHEIFKDLAVLVHEQGIVIDEVDSNIENSRASTIQAKTQLLKAARSQKSSSSLVCLLLIMFGVAVMIVIIVLAV